MRVLLSWVSLPCNGGTMLALQYPDHRFAYTQPGTSQGPTAQLFIIRITLFWSRKGLEFFTVFFMQISFMLLSPDPGLPQDGETGHCEMWDDTPCLIPAWACYKCIHVPDLLICWLGSHRPSRPSGLVKHFNSRSMGIHSVEGEKRVLSVFTFILQGSPPAPAEADLCLDFVKDFLWQLNEEGG